MKKYKWVIKDLSTGEMFISEHYYATPEEHAEGSHRSFKAIQRIEDSVVEMDKGKA